MGGFGDFIKGAAPIIGGAAGFVIGGPAGAAVGMGLGGSVSSMLGAGEATGDASAATLQAAREAEALNRERYAEAQQLLAPYIGQSEEASRQLSAMMGLPMQPRSAPMQAPTQTPTQAPVQMGSNVPAAAIGLMSPRQRGGTGKVSSAGASRIARAMADQQQQTAMMGDPATAAPEPVAAPGGMHPQMVELLRQITPADPNLVQGTPEYQQEVMNRIHGLQETDVGRRQSAYKDNEAYRTQMGMLDEYADVVGDASYDAVLDPINQYRDLVREGAYMGPMQDYKRLLDEGVDVSTLPGYQRMIDERTSAVNQGAAGAGSLYSGRRGEALADVGGDTQYQLYRDYMGDQGNVATQLQNLELDRLTREGNIARGVSGVEMDRLNRFGNVTGSRMGVEDQFYTNYMNILQNMSSPQTATNLASAGMNQGIQQGQQRIGAQQSANAYDLMGQEAQGAAIADIASGVTEMLPYMNTSKPDTGATIPAPSGAKFTPAAFTGNQTPMQLPDYNFQGL